MGRYQYTAYDNDTQPRYLVVWDLQWSVVESQQLKPDTDLSAAMNAAIDRLSTEGWEAEGTAEFGFVFIRNGGDRRLLMLTARDPYSCEWQSSVGRWVAIIVLAYVLGAALLGPSVFIYRTLKEEHPRMPMLLIILIVIAAMFRFGVWRL